MPLAGPYSRRHSAHSLLIAAFLVLIFSPHSASSATRSVTDANKGGSVQLKLDDILEVRLRSNPTTGYAWYVHPRSTPLLKLIGQSPTQTPQPGVGRPIVQILRFQAVSTGEGILLLHYVRAWERAMPAEEQFDLRVTIR